VSDLYIKFYQDATWTVLDIEFDFHTVWKYNIPVLRF